MKLCALVLPVQNHEIVLLKGSDMTSGILPEQDSDTSRWNIPLRFKHDEESGEEEYILTYCSKCKECEIFLHTSPHVWDAANGGM
ncbi:uncharacterized protein LACBIDRAFT_318578 [Laccaria bicolor S238N-H82]|uniref:Predicted protein n=1 Tax=Laccaria bicolor (strain S238N-H82 / ATCC MYA-4686) TaxID=486041 RepID=B0E2Q1_LACBS|nr:uncharacterized protein LACBIDRAFT_318578 [Laccaria bicolor S238N-H82]EDQ98883.1 predicted protein [Laccaria bicolor S238N-H82]|eukprot:XP_001890462.1 predicted protein [Laccaria bicolor S238N-H82]